MPLYLDQFNGSSVNKSMNFFFLNHTDWKFWMVVYNNIYLLYSLDTDLGFKIKNNPIDQLLNIYLWLYL